MRVMNGWAEPPYLDGHALDALLDVAYVAHARFGLGVASRVFRAPVETRVFVTLLPQKVVQLSLMYSLELKGSGAYIRCRRALHDRALVRERRL